jgi:ethanolamine utilization protein EutP (predicted NTPase)
MQFNEEIREKSVEFNAKFRSIRDVGLPAQIADNYETNYATANLQNLRYFIANITDKDIPYVNAQISHVEQWLAQSGMMQQ